MPYYVDVRYINAVSGAEIERFKGLSCLHASLLIPTDGFLRYKGDWKVRQIIKEFVVPIDARQDNKLIVHVYLDKVTSSDAWCLKD
jgi:hypothetical protein